MCSGHLRSKTRRSAFALLKAILGNVRDAEMTIKIIFERSSQKEGRQGVQKEGQQGTHPEFFLSAKSTGRTAFWKVSILLSSLFFPRKYSDNNFGQLPPSTQGVGLGGRKNPRIIGENSCHVGASYNGLLQSESEVAFVSRQRVSICVLEGKGSQKGSLGGFPEGAWNALLESTTP